MGLGIRLDLFTLCLVKWSPAHQTHICCLCWQRAVAAHHGLYLHFSVIVMGTVFHRPGSILRAFLENSLFHHSPVLRSRFPLFFFSSCQSFVSILLSSIKYRLTNTSSLSVAAFLPYWPSPYGLFTAAPLACFCFSAEFLVQYLNFKNHSPHLMPISLPPFFLEGMCFGSYSETFYSVLTSSLCAK